MTEQGRQSTDRVRMRASWSPIHRRAAERTRVILRGPRRRDQQVLTDTNSGMRLPDGLAEVLGNANVVEFVKTTLKRGYADHFGEHEQEASEMIDQAFTHLHEHDIEAARSVFEREWFKTAYTDFKRTQQPQNDVMDLTPHIRQGESVLDFGSGRGYLALELARQGIDVQTMDILDYRAPEARELPFKQMATTTDIPYDPDSIGTAIIKVVLHHVNAEDLTTILGKLHNVARRLIIVEETYNVPSTLNGYNEAVNSQPQMAAYARLSSEEQFQALMLNDYFSNIIVQKNDGMPFPFKFRTPDNWNETLTRNGFKVNASESQLLGFRPESVHRACQVLLVCDRTD